VSSLIDEPGGPRAGGMPGANVPEYSVSEISGAVKRHIEGEFGHVRVRGEVGRVTRHRSGHVYLDLKDERAVLSGVIWRMAAARLATQPEEGMEVVATGRLTTFPGQSKYQMVIDDLALAGVGALMAMLEKRRQALAAEGLFDAARKKPIPYLPRVIGVVTSPTGAVIRDILHRLTERFPVHVLVWPVAVQGKECAPQVAAAIRGFCRMPRHVAPQPDILIVARGGGSVEDLWGFNEEAVVRAAADCPIPLISAVGHETDVTLIDHAADRRAPTPSAAAEMAVPVRAELAAVVAGLEARRLRALDRALERGRRRLSDLGRALPRAEALLAERRQRLDVATARLARPDRLLAERRHALARHAGRLAPALRHSLAEGQLHLGRTAARLRRPDGVLAERRHALERLAARLGPALSGREQRARIATMQVAGRLVPRRLAERLGRTSDRLAARGDRLAPAAARVLRARGDRLAGAARMLRTLGYTATLARGFAVVRDAEGRMLPRADRVGPGAALDLQFADGHVAATAAGGGAPPPPTPATRPRRGGGRGRHDEKQGTLF
jgi:exodeoxyribonuclease VII large subunit